MHAIIILEYWKEIREGCNCNLDRFFSSNFLTINFAVNSKAVINLNIDRFLNKKSSQILVPK